MLRLITAEFKKIFKKIGIFVVTGLLIFILAASTFAYNPYTKDNSRTEITGTSVYDIFDKFYNGSYYYSKSSYDDMMNFAQDYIDFYTSPVDLKTTLVNRVSNLQTLYTNYYTAYNQGSGIESARDNLKNAFSEMIDFYRDNVVNTQDYIYVLSSKSLNNEINTLLSKCLNLFDEDVSNNNDQKIINDLEAYGFRVKLNTYISQLQSYNFLTDENMITALNSYITVGNERLFGADGILNDIIDFKDLHSSSILSEDYYALNTLISNYKLTISQTFNIVQLTIQINGLSGFSNNVINSFNGFENVNLYELNEKLTKNTFLFNTETYDYEYATPFSVSAPSNLEINSYDFSYYALRLCAFIVMIYVIVLAAGSIAGEQSSGTLKLLAIRPYSRRKILSGKIISVHLIGFMLLAISSIATLIIGGISYGFASLPILAVFNASTAFTISAPLLYIIMFVSILLEMSFFILVAIAISTIFTSNVGAVAVSILIYFLTMVLNTMLASVPFMQYIPLTCINMFRFFGSSFLSTNGNLINVLLTPTIAAGTSFWVSLGLFGGTVALFTAITFVIFKRRDIK